MTTWSASPDMTVADRADVGTARCLHCGTEGLAFNLITAPAGDLTLTTFPTPTITVLDSQCPKCGGPVELTKFTGVYWPDEAGLPALCWEAEMEEGEAQAGSWFLLDDVPPPHIDFPERLGYALMTGRGRHDLEEVDERALAETWGRPLSVRERWRLALAEAAPKPGSTVLAEVCPGMFIYVIHQPDIDDVAEMQKWFAGQMGELQRVTKEIDPGDGRQNIVVNVRQGFADRVAGNYTEWAGPWADRIGEDMHCFCLIERAAIEQLPELLIGRFNAKLVEAPPEADYRRRMRGAGVQLPDEGEDDSPSSEVWIEQDGLRAEFEIEQIAIWAAFKGTTLAEAAAQLISLKVGMIGLAEQSIEYMRSVAPEGVTVEARSIGEVLMLKEGNQAGAANLENLLAKFDYDPESEKLRERLLSAMEAWSNWTSKSDDEEVDWLASTCTCGQQVFILHLRPTSFDPPGVGPMARPISDVRGLEARLVPTIDCPHAVGFITPEMAESLQRQGKDIEQLLADGVTQAQFSVTARMLRKIDGSVAGVRLTGPNTATLLVHDTLRAQLCKKLRPRLKEVDECAALALTPNVVFVIVPEDDNSTALGSAIREYIAAQDSEPLDSTLSYAAAMFSEASPAGKIEVEWRG